MRFRTRPAARRHFAFLDRHRAGTGFPVGPFLSMVEIVAFTTMDFAAQLNDLPHSAEPIHLSCWHRALSERPSAEV